MDTETALLTAEAQLAQWIRASVRPDPNRLDLVIDLADLTAVVADLQQSGWGYLAAITGLDLGPEAGEMEVLYHFCARAAIVTLRVKVARATAAVPTLCNIIPSAGYFERELGEMFGISVTGAPNVDRLFLPDEWPQGVYPLRKDFRTATTQE